MPRKPGVPKLRRHKPSRQGVVTLDGTDVYLGRWPADDESPPAEVRSAYDRLIARWLANGRRLPDEYRKIPARPSSEPATGGESIPLPDGASSPFTVGELILRYFRFSESYYFHPATRGPP